MKTSNRRKFIAPFALGLMVAGFSIPSIMAQVPESILNEDPVKGSAPPIADHVEGLNRAIFKFNDGFYQVAFRPLSRGYATIVPQPVRKGIGNFFRNLEYPTRLVGNLLSGHPRAALKETGRFLVNTTFGIAGFVDEAANIPELAVPESDLGLAFASWGMDHGTYVVLPILGPSSLRDGIGEGISGWVLAPVQYLPEWEYKAIARGVDVVNRSPEAMQNYDTLKSAAVEPYAALRDAFASRRAQRFRDQQAGRTESAAPAARP